MLEWYRNHVKKLSVTEKRLFMIGRILVGFGLGELTAIYFPDFSTKLVFPVIVLGIILLLFASRGLFRSSESA